MSLRLLARTLLVAAALALLVVEPAWAQDLRPINSVTEFISKFLTGNLARSVAIIGVAVVGYLFYAGRIAGAQALAVVGGIALVFGAPAIVDVLRAIARG